MSHLGARITALVDGELDHRARERALAHLAHCAECRAEAEAQRAVKNALLAAPAQPPPAELTAGLLALAAPGGPLPPRSRTMPQGPVVPDLPPPGRPRAARPHRRRDSSRPGSRRVARRSRLVAVGALSLAGLVLGTAFAVGGATGPASSPVVPPVAELSVEHSRTSTAVTVGDPGAGLMVEVVDLQPVSGAATPSR